MPEGRKRIFAIDDDSGNLAEITGLLRDDYDVWTATCGEDAVRVATAVCPDPILLDVLMPGIDGFETCRRIRATPVLEHTKVLSLSARSDTPERRRGHESGADDFIARPFDGDELRAKINVFLRLKSEEEVNALKSDLLDMVTHELRTPLTGILPAAEILHNESELDDEERRAWTSIILECTRRLHDRADDGLLLCQLKSDAGRSLDLQDVDLTEVLGDVLLAVEGTVRDAQMEVVADIEPQLATVADRPLLQTAFRLLLENAVGFSTPGTTSYLDSRSTGDRITFRLGNLSYDLGGRDPDDMFVFPSPKIVEGEVAGIHMALVREVIRAHGGRIELTMGGPDGTAVEGWLPGAGNGVEVE